MRILVGVIPDSSASDAIALAGLLQRSMGGEVVLGNVYNHSASRAGVGKVDLEWLSYLQADAQDVLEEAQADAVRQGLPEPEVVMHGNHSSGHGLMELAETVAADLVVIGSAPGSVNGRFGIGSTANQLLHASHVPVALAPAGYRRVSPAALGRLVVAFQDTQESREALLWAESVCPDLPVTALTLLIRHRIMGSNQAFDGEVLIQQQLLEDAQEALDEAVAGFGDDVVAAISTGDSVQSAVQRHDWEGDELMVLASARGGVLRRVFLGDTTYKLVRATPVPAVVLPRHLS